MCLFKEIECVFIVLLNLYVLKLAINVKIHGAFNT